MALPLSSGLRWVGPGPTMVVLPPVFFLVFRRSERAVGQWLGKGFGAATEMVAKAVQEVTGRKPELSTTGGTSDARFIKNFCPVVEFGLVGQTMHAIDECVPTADLVALTAIYRHILDRYFAS